jgi:hypothetical protein
MRYNIPKLKFNCAPMQSVIVYLHEVFSQRVETHSAGLAVAIYRSTTDPNIPVQPFYKGSSL